MEFAFNNNRSFKDIIVILNLENKISGVIHELPLLQ
jgi:hypothetical protein